MKYLWICSLLVATIFPLTGRGLPRPVAEGVQVIEVTAKKYEFSPSPIRVKQGTKVQLKITAANHAHGFRITSFAAGAETAASPGLVFSTFPDCVKIEEGQTQNRRIRCADSWDLSI